MYATTCDCRFCHFPRFACVQAERLFAKDVFPISDRGKRGRSMGRVIGHDGHRINIIARAQFVDVGVNVTDAKFVRQSSRTTRVPADGNHFRAGM